MNIKFEFYDEDKTYEQDERFDDIIENNEDNTVVALNGKTIVGCIIYDNQYFNLLYIDDIFVLPKYRNKKIAKMLLEYCYANIEDICDVADDNRRVLINLHVCTRNSNIIKFYLNNGFEINGFTANYYFEAFEEYNIKIGDNALSMRRIIDVDNEEFDDFESLVL